MTIFYSKGNCAALMKRFWQLLALLLLALMAPASVCCWLSASDCEACACGSAQDHHDTAPAKSAACPSATIARSQLPAQVVMPEMQMVELAGIIHEWMRLNELATTKYAPVPLIMTTAPPELRTLWVFASRAALPARAPSEPA